uniref:Uncharacterized protein n=1 Tax=Panagrolaimus davidi TaxID=227884 RepID=A0A914PYN6_9BILA
MKAVSVNGVPLGYTPPLSSRKEILSITPTKDHKSELVLKLKKIGAEKEIRTNLYGVKTLCQFIFHGKDESLEVVAEAWDTNVERTKKGLPLNGVFNIAFFPKAPFNIGPFPPEVPFIIPINSKTQITVPYLSNKWTKENKKEEDNSKTDTTKKNKKIVYEYPGSDLDDEEDETQYASKSSKQKKIKKNKQTFDYPESDNPEENDTQIPPVSKKMQKKLVRNYQD